VEKFIENRITTSIEESAESRKTRQSNALPMLKYGKNFSFGAKHDSSNSESKQLKQHQMLFERSGGPPGRLRHDG
jgi:hypothetical protein